ncbi:MAG: DUF4421 family protein [Bacteroidales bacterium]|nr:DUF4421 family protein [Bacteroidales bacterium]
MKYRLLILTLVTLCLSSPRSRADVPEWMKFTHYPVVEWWLGLISPPCDSTYATPVPREIMVRTTSSLSGVDLFARGRTDNGVYRTTLRAEHSITQSLDLSFYGIGAGISINPFHPNGKRQDTRYSFSYYGNRFGFAFAYSNIKSFNGTAQYNGANYTIPVGNASQKLYEGTVHYVFNHEKFSLASALSQTWQQHRSAGSLIAGLTFNGGNLDIPSPDGTDIPDAHMKFYLTGLGLGYAYNLVTLHNWLIHISLLPEIGILSSSNITLDEKTRQYPVRLSNLLFVSHLSIVRWWGRYVLKINANANDSFLHDPRHININDTRWKVQVSFGVTL